MVTQIWANIGSGNDLLPVGTKPLPEPMLNLPWKVFCDIHSRTISQEVFVNLICNVFRDYTLKITITSPKGQWIHSLRPSDAYTLKSQIEGWARM